MEKLTSVPKLSAPPMEQSLRFATDPIGLQLEAQKEYGDIFELNLVGMPSFVIVGNPQLTAEIFATGDTFLGNGNFADFLQQVLGDTSVMFQEGAVHAEHKRALISASGKLNLEAIYRSQTSWIEQDIRNWPQRQTFALLPELRLINARMIIEVVLGCTGERASLLASAICEVTDWASTTMNWVADDWAPLKRMDTLLFTEISSIRKSGRNCLLHYIDQSYDVRREDYELRDMAMTLLIPGFASSSVVASWMLHAMMKYPEYSGDTLKQELEEFETTLKYQSLQNLNAFTNETMRLYPPLVSVQKRVADSYELNFENIRTTLHEGTIVAPSLPLLHWNKNYWKDPQVFDPSRFIPTAHSSKHGNFIPFGDGTHNCLGRFLAYPMTYLLVAIISRTTKRMRHPSGYKPKIIRVGGNLAASEEMPVLVG